MKSKIHEILLKKIILSKKIIASILLLYPSLLIAQTYDWSAPVLNANEGGAVTVDVAGNIISMGVFIGTIDANPGPNVFNLSSPNNNAVYIQKLDSNGSFLWAIALISNPLEYNHAYSLTTDVAGNVFFLGDFTGNVDFDPGPAKTHIQNLFEKLTVKRRTQAVEKAKRLSLIA